eukprot:TRINITY_DN5966_c0_g2_i4.p1 TRINITY_DN5966_c0_g2~~TRINITY_DN5966_c0_g2_i4.p1  ORF type:complete len:354 (-),score=25.76 TRINITY_DN5966_c0_g2_i4:214-1275(-)
MCIRDRATVILAHAWCLTKRIPEQNQCDHLYGLPSGGVLRCERSVPVYRTPDKRHDIGINATTQKAVITTLNPQPEALRPTVIDRGSSHDMSRGVQGCIDMCALQGCIHTSAVEIDGMIQQPSPQPWTDGAPEEVGPAFLFRLAQTRHSSSHTQIDASMDKSEPSRPPELNPGLQGFLRRGCAPCGLEAAMTTTPPTAWQEPVPHYCHDVRDLESEVVEPQPQSAPPSRTTRTPLMGRALVEQRGMVLQRRHMRAATRAGWNRWQAARLSLYRSALSSLSKIQSTGLLAESIVQDQLVASDSEVQILASSRPPISPSSPQMTALVAEQQVLQRVCRTMRTKLNQAICERRLDQ